MEFTLPLMSHDVAIRLSREIEKASIIIPPNRVLIAVSNQEAKVGSIILPDQAKEEALKKGVVLHTGVMDTEYQDYGIGTGCIITYGDYAGKKVILEQSILGLEKYNLFVLSMHEIVLVEPNNNK